MPVDLSRVAFKRLHATRFKLVHASHYRKLLRPLGRMHHLDKKAATGTVRSTVRVTPPNRSWRSQEWL